MEMIEIVIKGYFDREWNEWFEVENIKKQPDGTTAVTGFIRDQSEMFGILNRLKNLGIKVLKFELTEKTEGQEEKYEK